MTKLNPLTAASLPIHDTHLAPDPDPVVIQELKLDLLGALIGLGRAAEGNKIRPDAFTHQVMLHGIQLIRSDATVSKNALQEQIKLLQEEKYKLVSRCLCCQKRCGRNDDYLFYSEENTDTSICSLKYVLLSLIQTIEEQTLPLSASSETFLSAVTFLYDALFFLGKNVELQEITEMIVLGGSTVKLLVQDNLSFH